MLMLAGLCERFRQNIVRAQDILIRESYQETV